MPERSPWWYRGRGTVFLVLYALAFSLGTWLWTRGGAAPQSTFAWLAKATGASPRVWLALAASASVICVLLRVWGSSYLTPAVVWNPDALDDVLYVDGPFRYVRNPLYLGNIFLALGIGALATPCGFGIVVLGSIAFCTMLADHEARGMRARFGATFDAYRRAVPALLPRLVPARVEGSRRGDPSFAFGFRSELLTTALALGTVIVAVEPQLGGMPIFWAWIAGFVAQTIVALRERRRVSASRAEP